MRKRVSLKSPVRENRSPGSVRGAPGNRRPYRDGAEENAVLDQVGIMKEEFTPKQGQYLAFIHFYAKVNRRSPAEADIQRYFQVSPPAVHEMILRLEEIGVDRENSCSGKIHSCLVDQRPNTRS
jgi:hypothetical protein